MNKAHKIKQKIFSMFFFLCLILFNSGCGLDTIDIINSKVSVDYCPSYSNEDSLSRYFKFVIHFDSDDSNSNFKFSGIEVYYKIYGSLNNLTSELGRIEAVMNDENNSATAANKIIETYNYQPLSVRNFDSPLFKKNGTSIDFNNKLLYIRLDTVESGIYYSGIWYLDRDSAEYNAVQNKSELAEPYGDSENVYWKKLNNDSVPIRNLYNSDFTFREGENKLPEKNDIDFDGAEGSEYFYVNMYAIPTGYSISYSPLYGEVSYLGCVKIPKN